MTRDWGRAIQRHLDHWNVPGTCIVCDGPATTFRDALSRREYVISQMCQGCQDLAFAEPKEEPDDETEDTEEDAP